MKTPEEWTEEFVNRDYTFLPYLEDIIAIQRDAYRQGLVDATEAACPWCVTNNQPNETDGSWWHTKHRIPCRASNIWKLITAHDKEANH